MTANNTWVHVTDDHLMDAVKIHVTPPSMGYTISKQALEYYEDHAIYKVAKEMGHLLTKEIEKKLHDILVPSKKMSHSQGESFKGVNPAFSVMDEIAGFDFQMDLGTAVTEMLFDAIPGFSDMKQPCPDDLCKSGFRHAWTPLRNTIIHLNDHHKWSRERIADWLETLDHDLTFKTPGEVNADAGHADT